MTSDVELTEETIFTWGAPPLKFGAGAADEIGFELSQYGVNRVLSITDPGVVEAGIPHRIADTSEGFAITVPTQDAGRAAAALEAHEREAVESARDQAPPDHGASRAPLIVAGGLLALFMATGPRGGTDAGSGPPRDRNAVPRQVRSATGTSTKCVMRCRSATRAATSSAVSRGIRSVPNSSTLNDASVAP